MRPRSTLGLVRDRAPLPLALWIAARDGLVAELGTGGYAVLQRPVGEPARGGGYALRTLRCLDRQWPLVVFSVPPLAGVLIAAVAVLLRAPYFAVALALASALWVCAFLTSMLVVQVRSIFQMGGPPAAGNGSDADSLAFTHWSVRLVHQPDPDGVDDLLQLISERLAALIWADLRASAGDQARVEPPAVTETLVLLTRGITTEPARAAVAASLRAVPGYPVDRNVVLLAPPAPPERIRPAARRRRVPCPLQRRPGDRDRGVRGGRRQYRARRLRAGSSARAARRRTAPPCVTCCSGCCSPTLPGWPPLPPA